MTKYLYTLYDLKAQLYSTPFFSLSDILAMRDLSRAVNNDQSELFHNPEDFVLYCIGLWDDELCKLEPFEERMQLCVASELKAK